MNTKKLFFIVLFALIFLFFNQKLAMAYTECRYTSGGEINFRSEYSGADGIYEIGTINVNQSFYFGLGKDDDDTILKRYFFNGSSWVSVETCTPHGYSFGCTAYEDTIAGYKAFSEAKDYAVAGGWVYRDRYGNIKTATCTDYISTFYKETAPSQTIRLTYSTKTEDSYVLKGSKNYIGFTMGGQWSGYNTAQPERPYWTYDVPESTRNLMGFTGPIDAGRNIGSWSVGGLPFWASISYYTIPLPRQFTFNLSAATFNPGLGRDSYTDYTFGNMTLYTRDNQRNTVKNPPSLFTIFIDTGSRKNPLLTPKPSVQPVIKNQKDDQNYIYKKPSKLFKLLIINNKSAIKYIIDPALLIKPLFDFYFRPLLLLNNK